MSASQSVSRLAGVGVGVGHPSIKQSGWLISSFVQPQYTPLMNKIPKHRLHFQSKVHITVHIHHKNPKPKHGEFMGSSPKLAMHTPHPVYAYSGNSYADSAASKLQNLRSVSPIPWH